QSQFRLIRRLSRRIGITFPATETDEPAVRFRQGSGEQTLALFGKRISFVSQFFPLGYDFAHAFARKLERARERFLAAFRKLRERRRKKFGRRFRFYSLRCARVRIEFERRQRCFFELVALREQSCPR